MDFLDTALAYILAHKEMIGGVLAVIWGVVIKFVSTEKAMPVIGTMQTYWDKGIVIFLKAGELLKAVGEIIFNVLKSDGFMGKK